MPLQFVDIYVPERHKDLEIPEDALTPVDRWTVKIEGERSMIRFLVNADQTETLLDTLHEATLGDETCRIVVSNVEATLPRVNGGEEEEEESGNDEEPQGGASRISREELFQDVDDALRVGQVHYMLVILSTVVAAIGMLRNNVAVVIGAMVIAPLIGPNIALALGTTLGDTHLIWRAVKTNLAGLVLAFALAAIAGMIIPYDPMVPEIASRSSVNLADLILALAAGVAGTLSMTRGVSSALIGVMVAVALLPPLVAVGLFVGAGHWMFAYKATLLLLINITAINVSAVLTFFFQGVRPRVWYEAKKAKHATRVAILLWTVLLAILSAAILLSQ